MKQDSHPFRPPRVLDQVGNSGCHCVYLLQMLTFVKCSVVVSAAPVIPAHPSDPCYLDEIQICWTLNSVELCLTLLKLCLNVIWINSPALLKEHGHGITKFDSKGAVSCLGSNAPKLSCTIPSPHHSTTPVSHGIHAATPTNGSVMITITIKPQNLPSTIEEPQVSVAAAHTLTTSPSL